MTVQGNGTCEERRPKYVFFFIGDGMGPSQYQLTSNYLYRILNKDVVYLRPQKMLNFMHFPYVGTVMTPDSTSFVPDSASTATAMASGEKTHTMCINTDEPGEIIYEPLPVKLIEAGYELGIVTTAFMNDATPAAFYSRHHDRYERYPIAKQMGEVGVKVFAGGDIVEPDDPEGKGENAFDLLRRKGYTIVNTRAAADALSEADTPVYILAEDMDEVHSVPYAIDRGPEAWSLASYLGKTVELMGEDNFFIMCESGKIDWACHNNSAGTMIPEVIEFAEAVEVALDFAAEHPEDTLIIVTADHETGGLSQGFTTTHYMTYPGNYQEHKISYDRFRRDILEPSLRAGTDFSEMMSIVETLFGLKPCLSDADEDGGIPGSLELSRAEERALADAYRLNMDFVTKKRRPTPEEFELYGGYMPFLVSLNRIFNRKCGVDFSTFGHTATPVSIFARGPGAGNFAGLMDNTEIYYKLRELLTGEPQEDPAGLTAVPNR